MHPVQSHRRFALSRRLAILGRYVTSESHVAVGRIDLHSAYHEYTASILSSDQLSWHTVQVLNLVPAAAAAHDLKSRLAIIEASGRIDDTVRHVALAELTLQTAIAHRAQGELARRLYLLAAYYAHQFLFVADHVLATEPFDHRSQLALGIFNVGSGRYFRDLMSHRDQWQRESEEPILGHVFATKFVDEASMALAYSFDEYHLAWRYRSEGLRNRYFRPGVGVPLVALRAAPKGVPIARYCPEEGQASPVTVLVRFGEPEYEAYRRITARIAVHDVRHGDSVTLAGRKYRLSADFTAPLAFQLARAPARRLARRGLFGRVGAQGYGIRLLEPYDPRKIAVLMVHGLASSPQTLRELTNDIMGSPELRTTYQIWHYTYPTSQPFLSAASVFCAELHKLIKLLSAEGAVHDLVVIGHSMGGLLAKSLVVDSRLILWNALFTVSPGELLVDAASARSYKHTLLLAPWPEVGRLVFLGVPHHGCAEADSLLARAGKVLIRVPETLQHVLRGLLLAVTATGLNQVQPEMQKWFRSGMLPTSLDTLSPSYPLLKAFASLPVDARVPFHSIIGNAERNPDGCESDGYVSVESAHLDGATSELVLPVRHGEFDEPLVLNEIYRILRLHAANLGAMLRDSPT